MAQPLLMKTCIVALLLVLASSPASAVNLWDQPIESASVGPSSNNPDRLPRDSQQVAYHWKQARDYQNLRRYELARQHFLLALSACRSEDTRDRLQRELQIVDLQLRTLR